MSLNGIISTNNNNNNNSHIEHGHWSTELFDCLKDEETCTSFFLFLSFLSFFILILSFLFF